MQDLVKLAHGSGGLETLALVRELVRDVRLRRVSGGTGLDELDDSALIPIGGGRFLAVTVDSYTVSPIFFPGGDIGKLAASGTINDVAVMGAKPIAALDAVVVEEGFPRSDLDRVMASFKAVLDEEGVALIGGDFKVMPKGSLDGIVISTVGIGVVTKDRLLTDSSLRPGDRIVVSGTVGDHGAVILALQLGIDVGDLRSDCSTVTRAVESALRVGGVHAAKDPTRGGLSMALHEMAEKSGVTVVIDETEVPVREEVRACCEMLGVDPLSLACEGRVVLGVEGSMADEVVSALREAGCPDAAVIGEVRDVEPGLVLVKSAVGGLRILEPPVGEAVPRIC